MSRPTFLAARESPEKPVEDGHRQTTVEVMKTVVIAIPAYPARRFLGGLPVRQANLGYGVGREQGRSVGQEVSGGQCDAIHEAPSKSCP